jgi:hypothetical protein
MCEDELQMSLSALQKKAFKTKEYNKLMETIITAHTIGTIEMN